VRYDVLHPIKPFVLRELGKALDDKKRAVRKEAVDCRSKWYVHRLLLSLAREWSCDWPSSIYRYLYHGWALREGI
jgi:hypothetical protein